MDAQGCREFFGQLPTGVIAIVARAAAGPVGLIVGTFSSVSAVRAEGEFTANILAGDQGSLSQTLAGWSPDKFRNVAFDGGDGQVIGGCLAWAVCRFEREVEAGDHTIVPASPRTLTVARLTKPLVFFQRAYHRTLPMEGHRAPGWT